MLLKTLAVGLLLALAEIINGNIRVRILHRFYALKHSAYFWALRLFMPLLG